MEAVALSQGTSACLYEGSSGPLPIARLSSCSSLFLGPLSPDLRYGFLFGLLLRTWFIKNTHVTTWLLSKNLLKLPITFRMKRLFTCAPCSTLKPLHVMLLPSSHTAVAQCLNPALGALCLCPCPSQCLKCALQRARITHSSVVNFLLLHSPPPTLSTLWCQSRNPQG